MTETWKAISVNDNYEVSDLGRIRRRLPAKTRKAGIFLKPSLKNGYPFVCLCRDGKVTQVNVHRLVAVAFLGLPPVDRPEVNHKNGVKTDNCAENLEYVSSSENQLHAYRTGLQSASGERNGAAKLTESEVRAIRAEYDGKRGSYTTLARRFGVTPSTIREIVRREIWTHVEAAA